MNRTIDMSVLGQNIHIILGEDGQGGTLSSELRDAGVCEVCGKGWSRTMDGIESLILGHACAGVDVTAPGYVAGLESALEAIANNC